MAEQIELKKTTLHARHKDAGARLVPFSGWSMPVSYSEGTLTEHRSVRQACGIFDVSHMGEIFVQGPGSRDFLQKMTTNDASSLRPGKSQYSALLNENGGFIDDLFLYCLADDSFLLCVNAANISRDYSWLLQHRSAEADLEIVDRSDQFSQIAVQGPKSPVAVLQAFSREDTRTAQLLNDLRFTETSQLNLFGEDILLARTGYTGEVGFELYIPNEVAPKVWDALLSTESDSGVKPIGLGARDTLRLEACFLLYGNDMDQSVSPLEAGIAWAVKLNSSDFIGKTALIREKERGVKRILKAFKMVDQGIPRHGMSVVFDGAQIGTVTSGSVLPTIGGAGGLALVERDRVQDGSTVEIDVRGKRKLARIVRKPLYTPKVRD